MVTSVLSVINASFLILTFFAVRLVWGTIQTALMYRDIWTAYTTELSHKSLPASEFAVVRQLRAEGFPPSVLPSLIVAWTIIMNGALCGLNVFWFYKIVATMKRKLSNNRKS